MFTAQVLADGQLPDTQGAIYTVPFGVTAYVKQLLLFNTSASPQTIEIAINASGTPRKWRHLVLNENESATVLEHGEALQLRNGQSIEASSSDASVAPMTTKSLALTSSEHWRV